MLLFYINVNIIDISVDVGSVGVQGEWFSTYHPHVESLAMVRDHVQIIHKIVMFCPPRYLKLDRCK